MLKRRRFAVPELVCILLTAGVPRGRASLRKQNRRTGKRKQTGFTLLEMLVVCTIAGIVIAISGKGLSSAFAGNSRTSAVRVVSTTLFQARAIAIQRSRQSWLVRSGST